MNSSSAYRFRPGAIDALAAHHNLQTENAVAGFLGVNLDQLGKLRHGALVGLPMAMRVSTLTGFDYKFNPWMETVVSEPAA